MLTMWEMTRLIKDPVKNYTALWARAEYVVEEVRVIIHPNFGTSADFDILWKVFDPDNLELLKNRRVRLFYFWFNYLEDFFIRLSRSQRLENQVATVRQLVGYGDQSEFGWDERSFYRVPKRLLEQLLLTGKFKAVLDEAVASGKLPQFTEAWKASLLKKVPTKKLIRYYNILNRIKTKELKQCGEMVREKWYREPPTVRLRKDTTYFQTQRSLKARSTSTTTSAPTAQ